MEKNTEKYQVIKNMYDEFYKFLFVKHLKYPVKDTGIGYWGVTPANELFEIFNKIKLHEYNHLLDIGSGDGKVAMIASLFTQSTGIEYDKWLCDVSFDIKNKLFHIPEVGKTTIINDDFMNHNFSKYDVIYWHPDKKCFKLDEKMLNELNGVLVVYGNHSHPEGLIKKETFDVNGAYVSVYEK